MTTLHAGGKFGGENSGCLAVCTVGASVVNALSIYCKVEHRMAANMYRNILKAKKSCSEKTVTLMGLSLL